MCSEGSIGNLIGMSMVEDPRLLFIHIRRV
jgi:hypothetical protein